ncbi:beta-galactosidase [Paenibacillus antri]|uniref:Beta-galactosidase n=1 Tax=Paenibacillus antri TaxID=2582848 RepID=A0A5R9G0K7_9BACL|nr:beta-galactosidase [Paenibacillus antri]TLS48539.1 beta-galactosidase [Paenibacillus antri]
MMDVYHEKDEVLGVALQFFRDGEARGERSLAALMGALPGVRTRLAFPLAALDSERVFLPRTPGRLKTVIFGEGLRQRDIRSFAIGTPESLDGWRFELENVHFAAEEPDYPVPPTPIVDELGQYKRKTWPGKTSSRQEMIRALREEYDAGGAAAMPNRSTYGGSAERRYEATGYFRTERDGARWWLVDPDGYAFFSLGMDCVQPGEAGKVDGIEALFDSLPPGSGTFKDAWRTGEDGGPLHRGRYFNFAVANLIHAFGDDWFPRWAELTARRLKRWGFNTVGNWSNPVFIESQDIPYVYPLQDFPATERTVFRDFPDVFSDEFRAASETFAEQLKAFAGDRRLIGYFLRNEPLWAFADGVNLAEKLLEKDEGFESKRELIRFLQERYAEDVDGFNAAWASSFASFDALLAPIEKAAERSERARDDLEAFTRRMIEAYTAIPSEACKRVDPHHLNLGMRYAWISSPALYEGSQHFDVFSINCYKMKPDAEDIREIAERTGKPVLIGEFHFGAPDAGLLATGLRGVATQAERGKAYRYYTEQAAALPALVGVHYFILNDQALLGRFDGENFQIGAVDVCHRPYEDFIQGVTEAHARIYDVASGVVPPYEEEAKEIPRVGF